MRGIRIVVGIDFGTTYSGFSYAHLSNPVVATNDEWPKGSQTSTDTTLKSDNSESAEGWDQMETLKTNTVLKYDDKFEKVESWGFPALVKMTKQKEQPVELFKLYLAGLDKESDKSDKLRLQSNLTYEKAINAITDYFREMGKLIKNNVATRWPGIDFMYQVLFVLAVPAEFPENSKAILRKCALNAGLITNLETFKLVFTTEPEAAAIHCINTIPETEIGDYIGKPFLVVDCGGGTVDLTIRELLSKDELGEKTIRTGGFCGSSFVDQEFITFLKKKVGESTIKNLKENDYGQYQLLIHEFCRNVKLPFTGIEEEYKNYEFSVKKYLKQHVTGTQKTRLSECNWVIKLTFEDVKKMFDPIISQIIELIRGQLDADTACSIMFLVGGFSESKYLQGRIKEEFKDRIEHFIVPEQPITAVACGAVRYGINKKFIKNRVLKYTYGRSTLRPYDENIDPIDRKRDSGHVLVFKSLAKKGTTVKVDEKFSQTSHPENSDQTAIWYQILVTEKDNATYCDEESVKKLGDFIVELPDTNLGKDRKIYFELSFGEMEIEAFARNEYNGKEYRSKFKYSCNEADAQIVHENQVNT